MLVPIHMGLSFAVETNRITFYFNLENDVTFENFQLLIDVSGSQSLRELLGVNLTEL